MTKQYVGLVGTQEEALIDECVELNIILTGTQKRSLWVWGNFKIVFQGSG